MIESNNILYAPGLPTYGGQGNLGKTGSAGFSLYYSAFNGVNESDSIINRITNNLMLSSTNISLPAGRTYITGDKFVDSTGTLYEISISTTNNVTTATYTNIGKLNKNEYFYNSNVSYAVGTSVKNRIINNSNIAVDYVNTTNNASVINYLNYNSISVDGLSIPVNNFMHMNYCDVLNNNLYAFEIYTNGKSNMTITNNINNGYFNISTSIPLTLSSSNNLYITSNTAPVYNSGGYSSLISTNDIRSYNIFNSQLNELTSDNFNVIKVNSTTYTVSWDCSTIFKNVTNEQYNNLLDSGNIIFNLNVVPQLDYSQTPIIDVSNGLYSYSGQTTTSKLQELTFRHIKGAGSMTLSNLVEGGVYKTFLSVIQNGWEVALKDITFTTGAAELPSLTWVTTTNDVSNISIDGSTVNISGTYTGNLSSANTTILYSYNGQIIGKPSYITNTPTITFNTVNNTYSISLVYDSNAAVFNDTQSRKLSIQVFSAINNVYSNYITLSQSGDIASPFIFEMNIPKSNVTLTLPFTTLFNDYDEFLPTDSSLNPVHGCPFECIIDWGDESNSTSFTYTPFDENNNYKAVTTANIPASTAFSHTYTTTGIITVKIAGKIGGWSFNYASNNNYNTECITYITKIISWGNNTFNYIRGMFYGCSGLTSLPDIGSINLNFNITAGNNTFNGFPYADKMFSYCSNLTSLNVSLLNNFIDVVTNTAYMFYGSGITSDTNNNSSNSLVYAIITKLTACVNMSYMFAECYNIVDTNTGLNALRGLPSTIQIIDHMFKGCVGMQCNMQTYNNGIQSYLITGKKKLKTVCGLLESTNVKGMITGLFADCGSLEDCSDIFRATAITSVLNIWKNCPGVLTTRRMFYDCNSLTAIYDSVFQGTKTKYAQKSTVDSSLTPMHVYIPFNGEYASSITPLDSSISQIYDIKEMFAGCNLNYVISDNVFADMPNLGKSVIADRNSNDTMIFNSASSTDSDPAPISFNNSVVTGSIHNIFMFAGGSGISTPKTTYNNTYYDLWQINSVDPYYSTKFSTSFAPHVYRGCTFRNQSTIPEGWK